ncbi:MAG: DUF89 family protein [Lentisphaerae bacterium]|jgi:uncharacterized protein with ATP-grasp and redox domains|nr:DUF89 family protein [Lentisphaerota bacterium]
MKPQLDCIPCLVKNAFNVANLSTDDEDLKREILNRVLQQMASLDWDRPPTFTAWQSYQIASEISGNPNPYQAEKQNSISLAWKLLEALKKDYGNKLDDFTQRLKLAIAGNVLDYSIYGDLNLDLAMEVIVQALEKPIDNDAISRLKQEIDNAGSILYLLDNAGESVYDSFFIEPFKHKVTLGVRGLPASNDVTYEDLEPSGLDGIPVVDNATNLPGVIPEFSPPAMLDALKNADLIIAKGQGNFESLNETDYPIVFLFMAKCPAVCRVINAAPQSLQVLFNQP